MFCFFPLRITCSDDTNWRFSLEIISLNTDRTHTNVLMPLASLFSFTSHLHPPHTTIPSMDHLLPSTHTSLPSRPAPPPSGICICCSPATTWCRWRAGSSTRRPTRSLCSTWATSLCPAASRFSGRQPCTSSAVAPGGATCLLLQQHQRPSKTRQTFRFSSTDSAVFGPQPEDTVRERLLQARRPGCWVSCSSFALFFFVIFLPGDLSPSSALRSETQWVRCPPSWLGLNRLFSLRNRALTHGGWFRIFFLFCYYFLFLFEIWPNFTPVWTHAEALTVCPGGGVVFEGWQSVWHAALMEKTRSRTLQGLLTRCFCFCFFLKWGHRVEPQPSASPWTPPPHCFLISPYQMNLNLELFAAPPIIGERFGSNPSLSY